MTKDIVQDLIENGFKTTEDPQFTHALSLAKEDGDYESEYEKPEIAYDMMNGRFAVWTGLDCFVYTNHTSAKEAVEWANQISHFESN